MERITVGKSILPSGRVIERLALLRIHPTIEQPFRLLMADDGKHIFARQYPHHDSARPDEWDLVGPYAGGSTEAYARFGFAKVDLNEFIKDA